MTDERSQTQAEIDEQQFAMLFALAIHLGISFESLIEKTKEVLAKNKNDQHPWDR